MLNTCHIGLLLLAASVSCSAQVQRSSASTQPAAPDAEPEFTLEGLFESAPELSGFVVADSEPLPQVAPGEELWIRQGAECSAMARSDAGWSHQLLVCASDQEPVARCVREATVQNDRFALSSLVTCDRHLPDGSGEGWAHTASAESVGDLKLIAVTPESFQFGRVYSALPLPREVTIVEEPCLPGSRERAFAEHAQRHPGLSSAAVESAVLQTHAVYPNIEGRFCRRIDDWRIWVHEAGDHPGCLGADEENRDVAVDCSLPCPETPTSRRMDATRRLLSPLQLHRPAPEVVIFRSEAACREADGDDLLDVSDPAACAPEN